MLGLTKPEIMKVVNRYIGVSGGYLGDFSYRTHAEFYPAYCDVDINPFDYEGTTRERFIQILSGAEPSVQAKILRGVLERFLLGEGPDTRTQALHNQILDMIHRLETLSPVANPTLRITTAVVEQAITDAENLLHTSGATSGVDRIHTALHGYLLAACDEVKLSYPPDASLTALFKVLREQHYAFQDLGPRAQDITQVLRSCGAIMDALLPIRNRASIAHPNETLLAPEEAMLVLNIARTLLHYLDAKLNLVPF